MRKLIAHTILHHGLGLMSNAYAALFAIADADRDGVCGREEGFKFFQRFSVSQESLEEVGHTAYCDF